MARSFSMNRAAATHGASSEDDKANVAHYVLELQPQKQKNGMPPSQLKQEGKKAVKGVKATVVKTQKKRKTETVEKKRGGVKLGLALQSLLRQIPTHTLSLDEKRLVSLLSQNSTHPHVADYVGW